MPEERRGPMRIAGRPIRDVASIVIVLVLVAALAAVPGFASAYDRRFLTEIFMLITLAIAWNLVGGLAGYVSFGNVAFFGLGAYTASILMVRGIAPFPVAVLAAAVVSILAAFIIGRLVLRLRGHYFAIVTLGIAEAIRQLVSVATDLTGGGIGLNLPLLSGTVETRANIFYYSMLGLVVLAFVTSAVILRSQLGYGLRAIRASEDAAATLGVDTTRSKVIAFVIAAGLGGIAGGIYAPWTLYIDPPTVFSIDLSVQPIVLTLVGGVGTLWGPVVGGVVVLVVGEAIWGSFLELHTAFLGTVLIITVILLPRGLVSLPGIFRGGARSPSAIVAAIRRYGV